RAVIPLDGRTREQLAEVRRLGAEYMRPMGLEADRTGLPLPADHHFYFICARQGGLVSRLVGEGEEEGAGPDAEPGALEWRPMRALLTAEESAYWDRGVALSLPGPGLGGAALRSTGTPEQRRRFMEVFADHSRPHWAAMAMTEPGAGSDVARIQTRARRDGDEWVLRGQKMFCSNGARADWVVVWATVDPTLGRDGHRAFVVERGTPGFELLRVEHKMGSRGYETASFAVDDVRVPTDNLLGGEEFYASRRGFKGAMATFNMNRPVHAAQGVGMGRAAHDLALDLVRNDYPAQGRRRQRALERLAAIRRGLQTARLICMHAMWLATDGTPNALEASYSKLYAPPMVYRAIATALDIFGEAGVRHDRMLEKLYRDCKILDIGEGTQQVQRVVIARQLFDFPRDA
ncbi:MAG TPA: acyl-CoA dehydrogenase family protein, partial [Acidimicrobiales bacterium]|nr:acyl-CoA dehydrogenase family protein [Acidimicrobiales bacterium]